MIYIWNETVWWKQLLFIVAGGVLVSLLGAMLISPTGPGSSRVLFAVLAAYAFLLVLLGPSFTKIAGLVLFCFFIIAFAVGTKSKIRFEKNMKTRTEQMRTTPDMANSREDSTHRH